jgi:hypothetical protein
VPLPGALDLVRGLPSAGLHEPGVSVLRGAGVGRGFDLRSVRIGAPSNDVVTELAV